MNIGITTYARVREGEPSEGKPTHELSTETVFAIEDACIMEPGDTDDEPVVHLEFYYNDNPHAYEIGSPEQIKLDIPLSVWAGLVANIREKRKNPNCWQEQ